MKRGEDRHVFPYRKTGACPVPRYSIPTCPPTIQTRPIRLTTALWVSFPPPSTYNSADQGKTQSRTARANSSKLVYFFLRRFQGESSDNANALEDMKMSPRTHKTDNKEPITKHRDTFETQSNQPNAFVIRHMGIILLVGIVRRAKPAPGYLFVIKPGYKSEIVYRLTRRANRAGVSRCRMGSGGAAAIHGRPRVVPRSNVSRRRC
jgi:hypothetical protein